MKQPIKYKSDEIEVIASISTRKDRLGNVFYAVEYLHSREIGTLMHRFTHLSSAIDFIQSNLK